MHSIEEIIDDIRAGKMVILMDDEDRENEGDIIVAADKIQESHINFMAQYARGLICMPMSQARCKQLNLPLMVRDHNQSKFGTNFTVSIEATSGVTTGISVPDRTRTIQVAAQANAKPEDLAQPGHIFPIMAQPGGVLVRSGHTEASCDLAELAGLSPTAVICEILNEDGTMARRPQLEVFAEKHQLKIGTIADLIRYRLEREKTVFERVSQEVETEWGRFKMSVFESALDRTVHLVLSQGTPTQEPYPVRIQPMDPIFDLPGMLMGHWDAHNARWPLTQAMKHIADKRVGAIVLLGFNQSKSSDQFAAQVMEDVGMLANVSAVQPPHEGPKDWRNIGIGSQILAQLGASKLQVMGAPKKFHGLSGFGLEVVEYLPYTCKQPN